MERMERMERNSPQRHGGTETFVLSPLCLRASVGFLLSLLLTTPLAACSREAAPTATITVTRGPLVAEQSSYGELTPKKSTPIPVPEVPRVDMLTVKTVLADGTPVKKGDVVAALDTSDLEENLRTTGLGSATHGEVLEGLQGGEVLVVGP